MARKHILFEDDLDQPDSPEAALKVNHDFAERFEYKKRREEAQQCTSLELVRKFSIEF